MRVESLGRNNPQSSLIGQASTSQMQASLISTSSSGSRKMTVQEKIEKSIFELVETERVYVEVRFIVGVSNISRTFHSVSTNLSCNIYVH